MSEVLNSQQINNVSNLCEDPETKGFDLEAGQSWIYPTNYPVRNYQYNIIQEALHKNTLVSLPTGLGKTFIAAVVMYNFYRWYPNGKVIFMAPTRPLVEQQIDACYNIMAIPPEVTVELTGVKKVQSSRAEVWQTKRVFFITPQVLQNDLENVLELGNKIKCLVFDEAHKAKGNYAYCEVIRRLLPRNKLFRVLALSATPGNSMKDIAEVMQNLLISHLEFRNEESDDVKEYVFQRSLETVVVPLGDKLQQVKEDYEKILESYARILIKYKVIYGNFTNLTKGKLHMVKKEFQAKNRGSGTPHYAEIMKTLNICVTLYHGYEALIRCGLRIFLSYFEEHISNPLLKGNTTLVQIIEDLRDYLGPSPEVQCLPDGSFAQISASTKFGHPKFYRLRDILLSHFSNCDPSSRVIVFFEYKESVKEAYAILCQSYPTIKPRVFVGQGAGVSQKDQIHTIRAFRLGNCNTLLSTCIGEEGLDVGEVDLIVCFDTTNRSPIRMIQRMGRTGRKKEGRIIILVTEGKEQQTVKDSLICKNNLESVMTSSTHLEAAKYKNNPLMIPSYIKPRCQKLFITVKKPVLTKSSNIKDIFRSMSADGPKFFDDVEIVEIKERIPAKPESFWNKKNPLSHDFQEPQINFSKHLEKQRAFQACGEVKQSKQTEIFVHLLQFGDSKRFNIPVTQSFGRYNAFGENKVLKQSDIRSMFSKNNNVDITEVPCSLSSATSNYEKERQLFPEELFGEIMDYLIIRMTEDQNCKTCTNLFKCPTFYYDQNTSIDLSSWVQPDLSILDTITARDLEVFADSLSPKSKKLYQSLEDDDDIFDNVCLTQFEHLEEQPKSQEEKSFAYEMPKSFAKILNSFNICENTDNQNEKPKDLKQNCDPFVAPEIATTSKRNNEVTPVINLEEILAFFKLSSLEDLFVEHVHNESRDSNKTVIYTPEVISLVNNDNSPDLFQQSPDLFPSSEKEEELSKSPIICSYERTEKVKKKLFEENESIGDELSKKPNLSKLQLPHKSFYESKRITPKKSTPSKDCLKSLDLDISDICDLSEFGIGNEVLSKNQNKTENNKSRSNPVDLDISDVCDLSIFGLGASDIMKKNEDKIMKSATSNERINTVVSNAKLLEEKTKERELNIDDICDFSDFFNTSTREKLKSDERKAEVKAVDTNKKDRILDMDDFCDLSSLLNTGKKSVESSEKITKDRVKRKRSTSPKQITTSKAKTQKSELKNIEKEDLSYFASLTDEEVFENPKKNNQSKPQTCLQKQSKIANFEDENMEDDLTYFANSADTSTTDEPKNISNEVEEIVDLTDSPVRHKHTQPSNKTTTQLSITQMLSLVSKSETSTNKNVTQKENSTCSNPKPKRTFQKSLLSLNKNRRGLSHNNNNSQKMQEPRQNFSSPKNTQVQNTTKTPKSKSKFNISLSFNSDDEFEECKVSPIFAKPKPVTTTCSVKKKKIKKPSTSKAKKPKKLFSDFIEEEAVLSDNDGVAVSEDEEETDDDCFEASFVNDESQDVLNTTDIHAQYLKTTKSPSIRGRFKIPQRPTHNVTNVFSQEVNHEDDTYMDDSFIVNTEDMTSPTSHELSELEILEKKLKKMKKKNKKRKSEELSAINTKKRRIIVISDDSD